MSFIYMIIMGLIVGVIARAIKPGADTMGWILTIVLGIIGALVGGFLAGMLGMNANGGFTGLIFSVIGAIIVLFIYELATGKRRIR
ncbi:GlsB/YeaQ/YmgE family stress response membrane protein [Moraxella osloensis]|uniref:GlsB/YeaQ/YmgE family stress response membrane protein n=1 Tax=Faucicola osloensis TaxID=34062 RepID=A0A2I1RHT0_FAUOS|nr:GlsB/YeaQ/YmgE family stress response membrane protein [Moraxella osloensis]PKZ68690.1 GlsB/YeaQ/YmgE family stress response membrane protein [Moraxella osloensis]